MMMLKTSMISVLFALSTECMADLHIPELKIAHLNPLMNTDPTLAQTGLSVNDDDITSDQEINHMPLTETQLHEARVWGLTLDEEKRYVQLMQNRSAIYYEGLHQTPLDILGLNARNASERDHFAAIAAAQEAQKVTKNIAWNNAFYKAYNRLFQDVPVVGDFDPSPYAPTHYKPVVLKADDHLYLFITPADAVKTILMSLNELIQLTPNTQLNIMFLKTDDQAIQQWAHVHQIPHDLVAQGQINLNHGDLQFETLTLKKKKTPLLLLTRHGESKRVDLGAF